MADIGTSFVDKKASKFIKRLIDKGADLVCIDRRYNSERRCVQVKLNLEMEGTKTQESVDKIQPELENTIKQFGFTCSKFSWTFDAKGRWPSGEVWLFFEPGQHTIGDMLPEGNYSVENIWSTNDPTEFA